jgi:hypothetical protein
MQWEGGRLVNSCVVFYTKNYSAGGAEKNEEKSLSE